MTGPSGLSRAVADRMGYEDRAGRRAVEEIASRDLAVVIRRQRNGGDAETNAVIARALLSGELKGAKRDVVLINSGAALMSAGKADSLKDGIEMAAAAIDDGKAKEKLDELIEYTQENG